MYFDVVFKIAIAAFVGYQAIRVRRDKLTMTIVRGLRPRHFALGVALIGAVLMVALALWMYVPLFHWGWWRLVSGSPRGGVISAVVSTGTNTFANITAFAFIVALIVVMPSMAHAEECAYRMDAEKRNWPQRLLRQFQFGFCHLIMGIPLAFAIAISFGGIGFLLSYLSAIRKGHSRDEAVLESARTHLAYNWTLMTALIVACVVAVAHSN
jgi:hypothetical protein